LTALNPRCTLPVQRRAHDQLDDVQEGAFSAASRGGSAPTGADERDFDHLGSVAFVQLRARVRI
jgi:hypothetical protein